MTFSFSEFASRIKAETAFTVLAAAKQQIAAGKDVFELEIGDSPFPTPPAALAAGIDAIQSGHTHYGPSLGIPEFRAAAAQYVNREYGLNVTSEHVIAGQGAKIFEQLFCELYLNPGDAVLVFSPHFPTYIANIQRRGARVCLTPLLESDDFRPQLAAIKHFVNSEPRAKAIFLNSPHNPTGGVITEQDLSGIADLLRSTEITVFSDEPYDQMVWQGRHHTLLEQSGMLERTVAAYSFSKSFSMSGWRLGFAISHPEAIDRLGKLVNTTLSCAPPFVQLAGVAALQQDIQVRDQYMSVFRQNVEQLVHDLNLLDDIHCVMPGGSFYAFPNVNRYCQRYAISSHGLAMYLLEGADDAVGLACLGGECFGDVGSGYLRLSCAESLERLRAAVKFLGKALGQEERLAAYLRQHPEYESHPNLH